MNYIHLIEAQIAGELSYLGATAKKRQYPKDPNFIPTPAAHLSVIYTLKEAKNRGVFGKLNYSYDVVDKVFHKTWLLVITYNDGEVCTIEYRVTLDVEFYTLPATKHLDEPDVSLRDICDRIKIETEKSRDTLLGAGIKSINFNLYPPPPVDMTIVIS